MQVNDIQRPREYEEAVQDKESAREDIEVSVEHLSLATMCPSCPSPPLMETRTQIVVEMSPREPIAI